MTSFVWGRALSIAKKEVRHIWRDKFTLAMALGLPVALVLFFGFVFDFDVRDIHITVVDRDQTHLSRELSDVFASSQYFTVRKDPSLQNPLSLLDQEKAKAVLIIEPDFEKKVKRGETARVQVVIDAADNQTSGIMAGYLAGIQRAAVEKLSGRKIRDPIQLKTRFLFNPELNSRWFIVPGLTVVIIAILSVLLTALTVAREWENGSMELLLSTPVQPLEIIVGKLAPYTFLGLAAILFVYLAARVGFGVPFRGSHLLLILTGLLFLATTLSQGLLISVVTRQQQLAMQLANISGMLPSLLLSGFIFPSESMPVFFQYLTAAIPAKWFMQICRGLFLKGTNVADLAKPIFALLIIHVVLLTLASRKFKKDLEP